MWFYKLKHEFQIIEALDLIIALDKVIGENRDHIVHVVMDEVVNVVELDVNVV